ncbi:MAG: hypothetical protein GY807_24835 [Gammaproteobacteria bacterium]|nr:hypothetical protein [Gammaproteobacteria bacterium]
MRKTKYDWRFIPIPARDKWWMRALRKIPFVKWGYAYWTPPKPSVMSKKAIDAHYGITSYSIEIDSDGVRMVH